MKELLYNELSDLDLRLIMEAEKARENAYNPFSNFYVGAALLARDGTIIPGANVENSSYGLTLCAERSAMAAANAQGIKIFNKMVISTRGATFDVEEPSMSCGACRQWLYEFSQVSGIDLELIYVNTRKDKIISTHISELLPHAFGPKDLGVDVKKYKAIDENVFHE